MKNFDTRTVLYRLFLYFPLLICCINLHAQVNVQVSINDAIDLTSTCTDGDGSQDIRWRVNINQEGWNTYPSNVFCFNDVPNVQFNQVYLCASDVPDSIEVCFRVFEDDGAFCILNPVCQETICKNFAVPNPISTEAHSLALETGLSSEGELQFTISSTGILNGVNDDVCNAIDLGVLNNGTTLGDATTSAYNNYCASNMNEPNPATSGGWGNDRGVWFSFTTGPNPSPLISVNGYSDPEGLGDDIDMQVAVYESSDGTCGGTFTLIRSAYAELAGGDEFAPVQCLNPNSTYFVIVDGAFSTPQSIEGIFGMEIVDNGTNEAADLICDAEDLGMVPDNGMLTAINQSNHCALAAGDPSINGFVSQQSVWFQFTPPNSRNVIVRAISDEAPPLGLDDIGLQIAVFSTTDGTCTGNLEEVGSVLFGGGSTETLSFTCLEAGSSYWILVDGIDASIDGIFDIEVEDAGPIVPEYTTVLDDTLCFGESIMVGTVEYNSTGPINEVLLAQSGCDSLVIGDLTILPLNEIVIDTFICAGETVAIGNSVYNITGNYTDIISAANLCDSVIRTNLTVYPAISVTASQTQEASSAASADGAATAVPSGGTGAVQYEWSNGDTTATINNVLPGPYCVTVTDVNGCTDEDCISIAYPGSVSVDVVQDTLDCYGDTNGEIMITSFGGAPPYDYEFIQVGSITPTLGSIPNHAASETFSNLSVGNYSIELTDQDGISITVFAEVVEPALLIETISPIICEGDSVVVGDTIYRTTSPINEITTAANGCDSIVQGNLTVLSNSMTVIDTILCFGESINIGGNNYNATAVVDEVLPAANGCDSIITGMLTIRPEIVETIDTVLCFGESVMIGNTNYNTSSNVMELTTSITGCDSMITGTVTFLPAITTTIDTSLCFGDSIIIAGVIYNATGPINEVTNSSIGCDSTISGFVTILPEIRTVIDTVLCFGDNINVGNNNYDSSGSYSELLSASNGCDSLVELNLTIRPLIQTTIDTAICFGESITVANVSYNATGPINEVLTSVTDCDSIITGFLMVYEEIDTTINQTICFGDVFMVANSSYNATGNFIDIVTANNGCDSTIYTNLTVLSPLEASSVNNQEASAFDATDGIAIASATGGTGNYSYEWSNGEMTAMVSGLTARETYCVTITDDLACIDSSCVTIGFPTNLMTLISDDTLDCIGSSTGQLDFTVSNGLAPYSYSWSSDNNALTGTGIITSDNEWANIQNLPIGKYNIVIADQFGDTTIIANVVDPQPIEVVVLNQLDASCFNGCDGSIVLDVSGGTVPYQFAWSNGLDNVPDPSNVCAGNYDLVITDLNGCTKDFSIVVEQPIEFIASAVELSAVSCFEGSDGQALVTANGNITSYLWDNGAVVANPTNLTGGMHQVQVFNENNCEAVATVMINAPAAPFAIDMIIDVPISCNGATDASIYAEGPSPNIAYEYIWSTESTNNIIENIGAGMYYVTLTDPDACSSRDSILLTDPTEITATIVKQDITCQTGPDAGVIVVEEVNGGIAPYVFSIDGENFSSIQNYTGLPAGIYELLIEDAAGCQRTQEVIINEPEPLVINLGDDDEIKLGEEINLNPQSNSDHLIYSWIGVDSCFNCPSQSLQPFNTANYAISVIDTLTGCTAQDEIMIVVDKTRDVYIPNAFSPNADGANDKLFIAAGPSAQIVKSFRVFNRWGALVFELENFLPNDEGIGWDGMHKGKSVDQGVYIYVAEILFIDQETVKFSGDVTVLD